jgi:hypothetical protein
VAKAMSEAVQSALCPKDDPAWNLVLWFWQRLRVYADVSAVVLVSRERLTCGRLEVLCSNPSW